MRLMRFSTAIVALLLAAGCVGERATYDYDDAVDFGRYRRWAWLPETDERAGGDPLIDSPLTRRRIESAVSRRLAAKGYEPSDPAAADFDVGYVVVVEKKLGSGGASTSFGFGRYNEGSSAGVAVAAPGSLLREYETGTLIIDVRDNESGDLVWRGSSTRPIGRWSSPEESERRIDAIVAEILANFPPERGE